MDVVYVVRPGDDNEELRYSLRALAAHVPHDRVILAGFHPSWVTGVGHVPLRQTSTKYRNSKLNLLAACEHHGVSDKFLLFNDDMFAMATMPDGVPVMHRGPVAEVAVEFERRQAAGRYLRGMLDTAALLTRMGVHDPLCYDLHVPMPVDKAALAEAIEVGMDAGLEVQHSRTLYGNLARLGGVRIDDVKVCHGREAWDPAWPWVSTNDTEFREWPVGEHIRARFDEPCRYEVR